MKHHASQLVLAALLAVFVTVRPIPAQCAGAAPDSPPGSRTGSSSDAARPTVALVLGGGGARGIAHVGVLKVLEELHVPVDMVIGTSMGAIVGGLYAVGLTPDSMETWLRSADWDDLFRDRPSYSHLSVRRKRESHQFPVPIEVGIDGGGLKLPPGLVAGQKLNATLRSMTFHASLVSDFDSLAVPFRAVATDLETGRMVVLEDGDLVDAMRASMSAPGVFTPYTVGDRVLVDGGLVRNVPVDVACRLGADAVIAVDVGARLADRSEITGLVDLTLQVTRIMTRTGAAPQIESLGGRDVLVLPELGELSATDFSRGLESMAAGEAAAREVADALRSFAVDSVAYHRDQRRRRTFRRAPERVDFVSVAGHTGRSPSSLVSRIATRPGPVDTVTLAGDIEHLYSLGLYERVDYRIVETEVGNALELRVVEKPWGPYLMKFRLAISDRLGGEGTYNLATHVLVPQLNDWGAELETELEIGETRSAVLRFHQPLGIRGVLWLQPQVRTQSVPTDVYVGDLTVARLRATEHAAALRTGIHVGPDFELAFGFERGSIRAERTIGPPTMDGFDATTAVFRADVSYDGLDSPLFPRRGGVVALGLRASRGSLGADDDYTRGDVQLISAVTRGRLTLFSAFLGATSFDTELPAYGKVGLGGLLLLSGYRPGEIAGNHLAFGRAMLFREFGHERVFAGVALEAGNAWDETSQIRLDDLRFSGSLAVGIRTPIGPVYLGYGTRGSGSNVLYLEVGRAL